MTHSLIGFTLLFSLNCFSQSQDQVGGQSSESSVTIPQEGNSYRKSFSEKLFFLAPGSASFLFKLISSEAKESYGFQGTDYKYDFTSKFSGLAVTYNYTFQNSDLMLTVESDVGTEKSEQAELDGQLEKNSFKKTGLSDVFVKLTKLSAMNVNTNLYYGLELGLSPASAKISSTVTDGTRFSGGIALSPVIALEMKSDALVFGGFLKYDIKGERKSKSSVSDLVRGEKGGNTALLKAFSEYQFASASIGLSADLKSIEKTNKSSSREGETFSFSADAETRIGLEAYSAFSVTDTASINPTIRYSRLQNSSLNNFSVIADNQLDISVSLQTSY